MKRKQLTCTLIATLALHCLFAQDININLNAPRTTVEGAGFCHEGNRYTGDNYVLNTNIQEMLDNNMSLFRDMFPVQTFAQNKGSFNYNDQRVKNSFQRLKIMQDRGIKTILGIWDVPNWLVSNPGSGNNRHINNFDDFAWIIYSYLLHGKNTYGLTIDFVDVNETKTSGVNLALTAQEYSTLIQKCNTLFQANGITTRINMGSVMLWDLEYCKDIYNAVRQLPAAGYPSWHTYKGSAQREPQSYWDNWGAWRLQIDRNLWGTETDYDAFYWENPESKTWQGVEEMAVMYYRNYYVARMSTSAGWFWRKDFPSHHVHRAYMNFFEPGGQIVETSQPNGDVMTVAYKHVAKKKFVIQVVNQGGSARNVTFHGVPANKTFTIIRTSAAGDRYRTVGTVIANGTDVTVNLPGDSFSTIYGELEGGNNPTGAATVYADCGYAGNAVSLPVGTYTMAQLQALGVANDDVSSVQVQTGYKITLYIANNFGGSALVRTSGDDCLVNDNFNDSTSSIKVETNSSGNPNLAYQRPVFTTSAESATYSGDKAVDANGTTRWSSSYANNQSIVVDLGANYNVNRVRLAWEAAYARDYQIQFSTDNVNWTTVREFWGKSSAAADDQTGLTGTTRWVKVYCINRATTYGFSLFEFEVYGSAATQVVAAAGVAAQTSVMLYPNPVKDKITLQLPVDWSTRTELTLYNVEGKAVLKKFISGSMLELRVSQLPVGIYSLQLSNSGRKLTKKVVKQ